MDGPTVSIPSKSPVRGGLEVAAFVRVSCTEARGAEAEESKLVRDDPALCFAAAGKKRN